MRKTAMLLTMNHTAPPLARPASWRGQARPRRAMAMTRDEDHGPEAYSDEQLVEAVVNNGSQPHFRMLISRHRHKVHAIALSVLGPGRQADAEDVAQEVFVRVYRQLDSFQGQSKFSTWLYRISVNAAIDYRRKQIRHDSEELDELTLPASTRHAVDESIDRETAAIVMAAVGQLDQTQQFMVRLFYWQGFKVREIAAVLGCPTGTVKVYLQRARQRLASLLQGVEL